MRVMQGNETLDVMGKHGLPVIRSFMVIAMGKQVCPWHPLMKLAPWKQHEKGDDPRFTVAGECTASALSPGCTFRTVQTLGHRAQNRPT